MYPPHTLATEVVKLLKEHGGFTFNRPETENTPMVETSLDGSGLSVYGSVPAVVEFLLTVGFAVGASGAHPLRLTELMELTEDARANPDGPSIEVVLPAFLPETREG